MRTGQRNPRSRYPDREKRAAFLQSLVDRVKVLPGVISAGISNMLPLAGEGGNNLIAPEGTKLPLMERPLADIRQVNPDYFRTLGIPLRAGRFFTDADRGRNVALVSPLTADRLWPGQNPLQMKEAGGTSRRSPRQPSRILRSGRTMAIAAMEIVRRKVLFLPATRSRARRGGRVDGAAPLRNHRAAPPGRLWRCDSLS